jgi:hypothetical protein
MNWICDPGHAWLKVKIEDLINSGVANKISAYSYLKGENAYLEEDMDAYTYLEAIGETKKKIRSTHTNKQSRVRGYYTYSVVLAHRLVNYLTSQKIG